MNTSLLLLLVVYFAPSMIAAGRHVRNVGGGAVINILLRWTFLGWVVALAMAAGSVSRDHAPRGMETAACPRCNAAQNIPGACRIV